MRYPGLGVVIAAGAIGSGVFALTFAAPSSSPLAPSLSAAPSPQEEQKPPTFRGGTTFVYVDVYPRRDGKVIEGLTQNDFELTEDGKPQAVEVFQFIKYETALVDAERRDPTSIADAERQAADPKNRVFVVYLDPFFTSIDAGPQVKSTVMAFLTRTIGATDMFSVMTPETPVSALTFGRRLETLQQDLDEFWTSIRMNGMRKSNPRTEVERKLLECALRSQVDEELLLRAHREDELLTNLEGLMYRLRDLREDRKNVLFISEGWVPSRRFTFNSSSGGSIPQVGVSPRGRLGTGNQQPYGGDSNWCDQQFGRLAGIEFEFRFRELLKKAREANVSFFPVDVGGLKVNSSLGGSRDTLLTMAENTDGIAVTNTNDLTGAVRKLTDSLSAVYLIGYYSTNPASDGRYRQIKVRVKGQNLAISARPGYFAPTAAALAAATRKASSPAPPPTAVDDELGRLARARPDADVFAYGVQFGDQLTVVTELSSREMESGRWKAGASVKAVVQAADGAPTNVSGKIEPGTRFVTLSAPTQGATGPWKVDIHVAGDGGVLDSSVAVPASVTPLFGEPLLFRGNPSPRAPLKPVADFQFRRSERIHVEWRTKKPLTERAARLLDARGQVLEITLAVADRDEPAGTSVLVDLNLAPLTEGNYVIELTGSAGAQNERELLAFKIVR